jgi:hypothetical protein
MDEQRKDGSGGTERLRQPLLKVSRVPAADDNEVSTDDDASHFRGESDNQQVLDTRSEEASAVVAERDLCSVCVSFCPASQMMMTTFC